MRGYSWDAVTEGVAAVYTELTEERASAASAS
jgi:hypothetical protein